MDNVTHLVGFKIEDLQTPAFMRQERTRNKANIVTLGVDEGTEELDLEIPTFLRRQAD
ncbi:MAG: hypothetical protein BWY90_01687 [Deltaproteobacteria bacterium ADurb.BinA014]|nr:MAG: hypothetical protein BWY90_01687 [Deltaproteobacteria bacterium ADurb.BinA014]